VVVFEFVMELFVMYTLICNLLEVSEAERDADFPNRVDRLLFALFDLDVNHFNKGEFSAGYLQINRRMRKDGLLDKLNSVHGRTVLRVMMARKGVVWK